MLQAMLAQLARAVTIAQATLDALAQARAQAVVTALTTGPKALPVARVHMETAIKAVENAEKGGEKDVVLTLGLGAGNDVTRAPPGGQPAPAAVHQGR
ncbi:hypothetical protein [Thiomonas sp.]